MRHEIVHILLPNIPLRHLVLHCRALAEVRPENQPQSLDRSEISHMTAISHARGAAEPSHAATEQKFSEKLPIPARNVSQVDDR
jgi:hypothetical protein